jgi:hypothetical protein
VDAYLYIFKCTFGREREVEKNKIKQASRYVTQRTHDVVPWNHDGRMTNCFPLAFFDFLLFGF